MLEFAAALDRVLAQVPPPVGERVSVGNALGRILAEQIRSPIHLPAFDNSAMDGYAAHASDLTGATAESPARLRFTGIVAAGAARAGQVYSGACVRVFTGSPLPAGADTVVRQEDTRVEMAQPDTVSVLTSVRPGENVRRRGEDVKQGSVIAEAGEPLTTSRASLLAAVGLTHLSVGRQPIVGVLATGSELTEGGQPLEPGRIYESNRLTLAALLARCGGVPRTYPLVPDSLTATQAALATAFAECDLVVTSGGVSVGEMDWIKPAFAQLGGQLDFWKVAIKPGKPFVFGRLGRKLLFGVPGNPASAFVTFLLLVRPAITRWQGAKQVALPSYLGVLAEPFSNPDVRHHFMRVKVDEAGQVHSAGIQGSHRLSSLADANGLLAVPPQAALAAGSAVRVLRWE
jgi:molybdopterin molybdotransferase